MKKFLLKTLLFMLCFTFCFGLFSYSAPVEQVEAERTLTQVENELKQYKNELSKLQTELSNISKDIASLQDQSGKTTELIAQYQAQIEGLEAEIAINEMIQESYDLRRSEVMAQLAVVQEDYDYRVSMYKKMMQFIYENSETSAFELLFSSDSFSDYLTRRDNFNDIMNAANELIKDIQVSMADIEALDAELAEQQKQYDELVIELNQKKLERQDSVDQFETIAANLNINSETLSAEYANKNTTIKTIRDKIKKLEQEREEILNSSANFRWPLKITGRITSRFGWRSNPFSGTGREFHNGLDIACSKGTPIVAVKSGVVTRASYNGGFGECVIIYHGNGISTLYAHCDNTTKSRPVYEVKVGDTVKAGQVIAYVGTTGRSTGYHLHFGVIDTNAPYSSTAKNYVDPKKFLPEGYF